MQRAIALLRILRRQWLPRKALPPQALVNHANLIGADELTAVVRQLVADPSFVLTGWHATPFGTGASRESRLLRCHGTGRAANGDEQTWSLILKIVRRLADEGDPYAGLREAYAYESGLLQEPWRGLVAPLCYGVHHKSTEESWIWLEEVRQESDTKWTLENYTLAARHLGRFNSHYLDRPMPTHVWLARQRLAEWMRLVAPAVAHLPAAMAHPLMQHAYPGQLAQEVLHLWDERTRFLQAVTTLPTTLCHGDAFRQNLFARHHEPTPRTIAIDWAQIGSGPAGEDLASLVCVALSFYEIDADQIERVEPLLFQSYLDGLHDGGWQGSDEQVRLGYTIAAALRYGIGVLGLILAIVAHEPHQQQAAAVLGRPIEEVMQGYAHMTRYALNCANDARASLISEDL